MTSIRQFLPRSRRAWGLTVAAAVAWYVGAYPRGMLMAYIDHARGHYEIQAAGLPPPWVGRYTRLLEDRYGVRLNCVAGCVVTNNLMWYVGGYDSVSKRLLVEKHGRDIFAECASVAQQQWRPEHPEE
jgi:hypothetical protein